MVRKYKSSDTQSDSISSSTTNADQASNLQRPGRVSIAAPSIKQLHNLLDAKNLLDSLDIECEVTIVAAHWAPKRTLRYISALEGRGVKVIIAGAEGSAHLPGMIASLTNIPVIGVPMQGATLDGMDSLLSTVQMPRGVPVGTMAINSGYNAGIFAAQLLSLVYPNLKAKLAEHKERLERAVESEDAQYNKENKSSLPLYWLNRGPP